VIVDLGILYLGSVIDPESVLSRQKSAFTATAMTQVTPSHDNSVFAITRIHLLA